MDDRQRRIGLLGGSFNPAHQGHRDISIAALKLLGLDEVWWLVTPGNPLKDPAIYAGYMDRMASARRLADHPQIVISDFEQKHNLQYTVDTLKAIKEAHSDKQFAWLMGADSLAGFHKWKDWETIAASAPIAVFNRPGHEDAAETSVAAAALKESQIDPETDDLFNAPAPRWAFFAETNNPLSSTALRNEKS